MVFVDIFVQRAFFEAMHGAVACVFSNLPGDDELVSCLMDECTKKGRIVQYIAKLRGKARVVPRKTGR